MTWTEFCIREERTENDAAVRSNKLGLKLLSGVHHAFLHDRIWSYQRLESSDVWSCGQTDGGPMLSEANADPGVMVIQCVMFLKALGCGTEVKALQNSRGRSTTSLPEHQVFYDVLCASGRETFEQFKT